MMEAYVPVILAAVVLILAYFIVSKPLAGNEKGPANITRVEIGGAVIHAEIADTLPKRMIGLMLRKNLPEDGGMLFLFDSDGYHGIWMPNMSFPIDIIWIDSEHKIVDIVKDAPPCGIICTKTYSPKEMARYVLEMNAGFADEHGIDIGDNVNF